MNGKHWTFKSLNTARHFRNRTINPHAIVLGDDDRFWVVNIAEMERLVRGGHEVTK
jgi:hypothetical protein